jgi:hypothetical protein
VLHRKRAEPPKLYAITPAEGSYDLVKDCSNHVLNVSMIQMSIGSADTLY